MQGVCLSRETRDADPTGGRGRTNTGHSQEQNRGMGMYPHWISSCKWHFSQPTGCLEQSRQPRLPFNDLRLSPRHFSHKLNPAQFRCPTGYLEQSNPSIPPWRSSRPRLLRGELCARISPQTTSTISPFVVRLFECSAVLPLPFGCQEQSTPEL